MNNLLFHSERPWHGHTLRWTRIGRYYSSPNSLGPEWAFHFTETTGYLVRINSSTLLPVERLLNQLHAMDDSHSPTTTEVQEFQEVPIAKTCPGEIQWNATISRLYEFQQTQLLKHGFLFETGFIMISSALWCQHSEATAHYHHLPPPFTHHQWQSLSWKSGQRVCHQIRHDTWRSTEIHVTNMKIGKW